MAQLYLTKELFDWVCNECEVFKKATWAGNDVDAADVLYSFFHSTPEKFALLEDWDEGKGNDPFWNDTLNEHSCIVFLREMVNKLNSI